MHRKFPSLAQPQEFGYAFDTGNSMDRRATIEPRFRVFQTMGDGLTQHSPDWSVLLEQLTDYLWSLAAVLPGDEELLQSVSYIFHQGADEKTIEFASKIVTKDNPDSRHYNLREQKIAKNPKIPVSQAEHWKPVPSWADGSAKAIYGLITPGYADGLMKFGYACALHRWCMADTKGRPCMSEPARFLDWFKDYEPSRILESGYYTCRHACEAHRLAESVKSSLANHKEWLERKRQPAA